MTHLAMSFFSSLAFIDLSSFSFSFKSAGDFFLHVLESGGHIIV